LFEQTKVDVYQDKSFYNIVNGSSNSWRLQRMDFALLPPPGDIAGTGSSFA